MLLVEVLLKRQKVSKCDKRLRSKAYCGVKAKSLILNVKEI